MAVDEFGDLFGGGDFGGDIPTIDEAPGLGFSNDFGGGGWASGGGIDLNQPWFLGGNNGPGENTNGSWFGFGGDSGIGGGNGGDWMGLLNALTGNHPVQAGLGALGTGVGLAGLIQGLVNGPPGQQITHQVSPQERQLTAQTLASLQNLRGLAQNAQLNQAVSRLAAGQLPISPDLVSQVTKAFGGVAGNLAQGSIENARQRGFQGGTELLGGAGSPQYAQSMAQLQSDVSNALVNLAVGLPQTASNINAQQMNASATPIMLQNDLQRLLGSQGTINTQQTGGSSLLQALAPAIPVFGATGGLLNGLNAFNQNQNQNRPQPVQQQQTRLSGP